MKPHKVQNRILFIVGSLVALASGILVFTWLGQNNMRSIGAGPIPTTTPGPSATAWYDHPLISPEEREFYRRLPPEKQAPLQRDFEARLRALNSTPLPGATKPMPTLEPGKTPYASIPQKPAGSGAIVEDGPPPFCGTCFVMTNMWYEIVSGKNIRVYAGALPDNPGVSSQPASQGMVIVWGEGNYPTPIKVGPVRVVDARGERLILQSENGTTFYFDVPARRFVGSLTEVVPTATSAPIPIPTATPTQRPYP